MIDLKNNMIDFSTLSQFEIGNFFNLSENDSLCFDTESCEHELDHNRERVYAWGISSTSSDRVIYGVELEDAFYVLDIINEYRIKNILQGVKYQPKKHSGLLSMQIFVHNLAWDLEFMKYTLSDMGYNYHLDSTIIRKKKKRIKAIHYDPKEFSIVENDNIVYSARISASDSILLEGKKNDYEVVPTLNFIDSYKIMPQKLESIAKEVVNIDEKYYKKGDDYDYDSIRPLDHELSNFELEYLYCDVYILKEFIIQFYLPLNTNYFTASGIAFEFFLNNSFEGDYKKFEEHYPYVNSELTRRIIKRSYRGGWTQSNRKYTGQVIKKKGVMNKYLRTAMLSIDINSSYPSVVAYKMLPYGQPKYFKGKAETNDEYQMALYTIQFDAFKNINNDDLIGHIQVGSKNVEYFNCVGTEYIHTNIGENGEIIGVGNEDKSKNCKSRYEMQFWSFELEDLLKYMKFYVEEKEVDFWSDEEVGTGTLKEGFYISNTILFKGEVGRFKDAVDLCMMEKNEGKLTVNNCKQMAGKLKANSFYGKMASKAERVQKTIEVMDNGLMRMSSKDAILYESERYYYPAFASAVTAWARCNLRNTLYKVGYNNVLYFDTDSLYTTLTYNELMERGINLDSTELGAWDIEKAYHEFKAIASKKYILKGIGFKIKNIDNEYEINKDTKLMCKCAGLPSEVRETIKIEGFALGETFRGKKQKTRVLGGYRLTIGDYTLKAHSYDA